MSRVLITGGTGFLGCHLARLFLKEKHSVTLLDIAPLDARDLMGKVKVIACDVRDKKKTANALRGQDYVVHAAAALPIQRTKEKIFSVNVDGSKNVLDGALKAGVKQLVFISTTAMYGVPKHLPETEESPIDPIGFYGQSKAAAEKLCQEYEKKGLHINIIRPKTFLGPERLGVFTLWFEAIYTNHRVFILGPGNNKYQLLAVTDVADAIAKALFTKIHGEIFNIGAKKFGTWREDLGVVITKEKSTSKITGIPTVPAQLILGILEKLNLSPIAAWHYKTMPVPSYVSIAKAEKQLHWHPKKSNQELFQESYEWYKKNRSKLFSRKGETHRVGWKFGILDIFSKF
ncbi:MAG: NAD-dependent epimerase/dehydratase family protein [Nitrospiria bacterium]